MVVNTVRAKIIPPFFQSICYSGSVFVSYIRDTYQEFIICLRIKEPGLRNWWELSFPWIQKVKDKYFVPMMSQKL
tara:strand:- start:143 stop:367 length:225 start_codon:yes stop_codon:yes gene_type:complete